MSINPDGTQGRDDWAFEDVTAQTRIETYEVNSEDLDGSENQTFAGGPDNIQPTAHDDPLSHNEVAELVAITLDHMSLSYTGPVASEQKPTHTQFEYDITLNDSGTDAKKSTLYADQANNGVFELVNEVDNDQIAKFKVHAMGSFNDSTNGTGGSGQAAVMPPTTIRNFREEFERGPVLDDNDKLGAGYSFIIDNLNSVDVTAHVGYTCWWDVFETDIPDYRDIL